MSIVTDYCVVILASMLRIKSIVENDILGNSQAGQNPKNEPPETERPASSQK